MLVHRYDKTETPVTSSDPLTVLISWLSGLRSVGYTTDIMNEVHGIHDKDELKRGSILISTFAENAVALLDQSYSGSEIVSFLPLYYAMQNLAKIYIVLGRKRVELLKRKHQIHGVSRVPRNSRKLLTEELSLKPNGTIPLFYRTLTGESWGKASKTISLNEIYPYINGVSYEFERLTGKPALLEQISIEVIETKQGTWRIEATLMGRHSAKGLRHYKVLKGFRPHSSNAKKLVSRKTWTGKSPTYSDIEKVIRRCLLISDRAVNFPLTGIYPPRTPICAGSVLFPQEFPIILAFFHLSTMVRYFPEFMQKIRDSNIWSMLLNLRADTTYGFLLAFWSNLHKTNYILQTH